MHDGNYALWSGDVSDGITPGVQDGLINFIDHNELENALPGFITGYNTLDLTGDRIVESGDFSLVENNDVIVISRSHP
jgi:hypothetical protein